jgi:hypothetical protein
MACGKAHLELPSTKPSPRPDAAGLPFQIPEQQLGDFDWLMDRTSFDQF